MGEVKEKIEADKPTRSTLVVNTKDVHSRILTHQISLIGERKQFVTVSQAAADLLERATRDIAPYQPKYKYEVGDVVLYRSNGEDPEPFEIEARKIENAIPYYLVDGRYIPETFLS